MCPLCRGPLETKYLLEAARDEEEEGGGVNSNPYEDILVDLSSSKINATMQELENLRRDKPGEKTIIVSQFTSLLSIVQPLLNQGGYKWTRLDGTMSTRHRSEVIADFQDTSAHSPTILLLSLRAGKYTIFF
jgi:SNF2 family DNA or RNA helicase